MTHIQAGLGALVEGSRNTIHFTKQVRESEQAGRFSHQAVSARTVVAGFLTLTARSERPARPAQTCWHAL